MYKNQSRRIGKFKERISITVPTQTSNGQGGFNTTYAVLFSAWAAVELKDDSYYFEGGQRVLQAKYNFTIRFRADKTIPLNAVIVWNLKRFKLNGVPIKDVYNTTWNFNCVETSTK